MIASPEQLGLPDAGTTIPRGWTPDGRELIVQYADENSQNIGVLSEDGELSIVLDTPATEVFPSISPNGRWLAYASDETGQFQVYVPAFPGPCGKWQISTTSGNRPSWSPDGTELFYKDVTNLYGVSIDDSGGGFRSGQPEVVFDDLVAGAGYDIFDSNRFLLVDRVGDGSKFLGATVVVNWLDELERLVP